MNKEIKANKTNASKMQNAAKIRILLSMLVSVSERDKCWFSWKPVTAAVRPVEPFLPIF